MVAARFAAASPRRASSRNRLPSVLAAEVSRVRGARTEPARLRIISDYIAGMTEDQAVELYRGMSGISSGSILDAATG